MVSNWVTLAEAMVSGSGKATCKKPSDPFIMAEKKVMGSGVWTGPGLSSPPGGVVSGGTDVQDRIAVKHDNLKKSSQDSAQWCKRCKNTNYGNEYCVG